MTETKSNNCGDRMDFNFDEFFKTVDYKDSILHYYLKNYDNWNVLEGLLLLSGLHPKKTTVFYSTGTDVEDYYDNLHNVKDFLSFKNCGYKELPHFYLDIFQPLDVDSNFSDCMIKVRQIREIEERGGTGEELAIEEIGVLGVSIHIRYYIEVLSSLVGKDLKRDQVIHTIYDIHDANEFFDKKFRELVYIWFSGDHWDRDKVTYPKKDFIKWAQEKDIDVPWFNWAIENFKGDFLLKAAKVRGVTVGELTGSEKKDKPLDPRKEKTYQIIIGALLEYIEGNAPDVAAHPDFKSQKDLIVLFESYELYGLSKPTLERRFSEARKAYKHEMEP